MSSTGGGEPDAHVADYDIDGNDDEAQRVLQFEMTFCTCVNRKWNGHAMAPTKDTDETTGFIFAQFY